MTKWIRFDEREDVLASTDLLPIVIPKLGKQPALWKWTIIAAHSGAQGALVYAIKDTAGTNVLSSGSAKQMMEWQGSLKGDAPPEYLAKFLDLLKKYRRRYPHPALSDSQSMHLRKLNDLLRNNFVHFVPKGWSIEAAGLSAIIISAVDLIEEAMGRDQVRIHLTGNMKRRLQKNLKGAKNALDSLGKTS